MTWAKGYYDSASGKIVSEWSVNEDKLTYKCTVPENTTATLYLPDENGRKVFELTGGSYMFETK